MILREARNVIEYDLETEVYESVVVRKNAERNRGDRVPRARIHNCARNELVESKSLRDRLASRYRTRAVESAIETSVSKSNNEIRGRCFSHGAFPARFYAPSPTERSTIVRVIPSCTSTSRDEDFAPNANITSQTRRWIFCQLRSQLNVSVHRRAKKSQSRFS